MKFPTRFDEPRRRPSTAVACAAVAVFAALGTSPSWALFKVVNPDGTITYTDRPPQLPPNARITNMARPGSATVTEPDQSLPPDLRQPVQRHPVVLYTTSECAPCETGRQLLTARGIPFNERRVESEEDAQAFERLFGTRTLPLLTVGAQALKGLSDVEWGAYLDAAGYPRQSRLPRNWQARAATPMVERAAPPPAATRAERTPPPPSPPPEVETETQSSGTRLRF